MDKTVIIVTAIVAIAFMTLVGSISLYNMRTNVIYADLIKAGKDPLAVRCAWNGDMQVCAIAGARSSKQ